MIQHLGLRTTIVALLADERSGKSTDHLDKLLMRLCHCTNCHEELLKSLTEITPKGHGCSKGSLRHTFVTDPLCGDCHIAERARNAIAAANLNSDEENQS